MDNDAQNAIFKLLASMVEARHQGQEKHENATFKEIGNQRLIVSVDKEGVHVDLPRDIEATPIMLQAFFNKLFDKLDEQSHAYLDMLLLLNMAAGAQVQKLHDMDMKERIAKDEK